MFYKPLPVPLTITVDVALARLVTYTFHVMILKTRIYGPPHTVMRLSTYTTCDVPNLLTIINKVKLHYYTIPHWGLKVDSLLRHNREYFVWFCKTGGEK